MRDKIHKLLFTNKLGIKYTKWENTAIYFGMVVGIGGIVLACLQEELSSGLIIALAGYIYMLLAIIEATKRRVKILMSKQ